MSTARIKFKSYPMSRCGTMTAATATLHRHANTAESLCVHLSKEFKHLDGPAFEAAWKSEARDAGFVFAAGGAA